MVLHLGLAFVLALVGAFLLGCAVLAMTFLVAPAAATIAGHIAAMFGFPAFFLAALASSVFRSKAKPPARPAATAWRW
jgi:hypothetical protein